MVAGSLEEDVGVETVVIEAGAESVLQAGQRVTEFHAVSGVVNTVGGNLVSVSVVEIVASD